MSVPSKRAPRSRKYRRRSHEALKPVASTSCAKCGSDVLPHHACSVCGTYRGRTVLAVKNPFEKKKRKKETKEEKQ